MLLTTPLLPRGIREASGLGDEASENGTPWLPYLVAVPLIALGAILAYTWGDLDIFAVAALVAIGAFLAGGLLGFLFGIPRSLAGPPGAEDEVLVGGYSPNTNLEQISDWLTKILVGVGLVQFTTLARHAGELVNFLGPPLGGDSLGEAFAGATLVTFSVSGFLAFYLVTRIYLGRAFAHADRRTRDLEGFRRVRNEAAAEELKRADLAASTSTGDAPIDDSRIMATVGRAGAIAETRGPAQVLWVDDRPENNTRERNAMTTLGMHVVTCLSTEEALDLLRRSHFDVVISDMGRPPDPQAGYTLLEAMRAAGDTTPFIIYAGSNLPEHKQAAQERGALGSTNRPQELVDLVVQAVNAPR